MSYMELVGKVSTEVRVSVSELCWRGGCCMSTLSW